MEFLSVGIPISQQEQPIRIFGTASPGEKVTAALAGKTASTTATADGYFRVELPAMKADGKAHTLTVTGKNTVKLTDVLLGEVWICSGQSNMSQTMYYGGETLNKVEERAAADHPQIRLFNVKSRVAGPVPLTDARGTWRICSPHSAPSFSAVGYFFGRALLQKLKVPIGLIGTHWGNTQIEPWTPPVGFRQVPQLKDYPEKKKGGHIYNGMVNALTPLSVRGAIWYQGESNGSVGLRYEYLQEALVKGWRSTFENENLSFYWVQLANFREPKNNPAGGGWGPIREGQRRALKIPKTGMAVAIDIGDARNIHPRNKQDVGARLALWALAKDYGQDIVYSGPLYKSMKVEGDKIRITFDQVGGGLVTAKKEGLKPTEIAPGAELTHFAIQGADNKWHWAKAKIDGKTVVVWADGVSAPKHVRFGYQSNPVGINLYNKEGLPASPFTTD